MYIDIYRMEQQARPKKEMTPEQLEILKARLMKAREAKLTRDNKRYVANKEQIKEDGLKKRTMNKVKALVSKGAVKEEELKEILPKKEEEKKEEPKQIPITTIVDEITKEIPFEKPLPKKRAPKPKPEPQPQPEVIPFEKELPTPKSKPHGMGWKYPADPIDIPKKKEKDRFMKLVYYKEPSKKTLKKLEKLQESSSSESESSFDDEVPVVRQQKNDEDAYYRALAKKLYG
jgi:hypothetical protein